ncbi:MAG: hypothetical protein LC635_06495, partial [Pseudonocardiaceae bacterium]|nr:hypothetical protein [Pseudonocardiaceae bacterium]
VRIAHTPELGHLLMPRLQVALRELPDHAAGRWMPELMHTSEQLNCLADGRIDVGLCWDVDTVPGLRSFVLAHVPMVAVLNADDPLAEHGEISLELLRDRHVLVTPRRDNPFIDARMRSAFSAVGRRRGGLVEVPRYDELPLQVAASRRIGLHPGTIALANRVPGIVFRRVAPPTHVTICVVVREAVADDPPLRLLVELLGQVAAGIDVDGELSRP